MDNERASWAPRRAQRYGPGPSEPLIVSWHRIARPRPTILLVLLVTVGWTLAPWWAAPALAHQPGSNGCTGVPDSGPGFAFHNICDRHDSCYRTKPYGTAASARAVCDRVFGQAMNRYCQRHSRWSAKGVICRSTAAAYYHGVRTFGWPAWKAGLSPAIG